MTESNIYGKAQSPEELVELIDKLMSDGSGHVNIFSEQEQSGALRVETVKSTDCGIKGACCQPNERSEDED